MRLFVPLFIVLALQGCGYKGPLYLPKEEPAKPAAPAQPANTQQDNKQ